MCGTVAWLRGNTCGDDEQFDLAAWFPSLKYSWSRVASFYIFQYLGRVNSAGSFNLVAVIKFTKATNSRLIFILYNGGTVLLLYYSGYTHATILLRYLSALLDKF